MKSSLYLNGFPLFSQIYSDQPPLYTVIVSFWFKLFGSSVYQGRLLILIFSLILILTFYHIIKIWWGNFCAFMAAIFLLSSSLYIPLSASVMIGTASLSLAMLSIYCITLYRKLYLKRYLILSAIFIALSLHTKLFTLFLLPLIPLEIIHAKRLNAKKTQQNHLLSQIFRDILLWFGIVSIIYLSIAIIFFHFNLPLYTQLLAKPHLKKLISPGDDFLRIWKTIRIDYDIALLALIGVILLIKQKAGKFFLPLLWLILVFIIYVNYSPVWAHYYLLFSIPLCWLAAIYFRNFSIRNIAKKGISRWLIFILITVTILRLPFKYNTNIRNIENEATTQEYKIINNLLLKYKPFTRWIVTNRPIFAFYANLMVPPELVLTSHKRRFTDKTEQSYFIDRLEEYKPEQILLVLDSLNFYGPEIISYIEENYFKIYGNEFLHRTPVYSNFPISYFWEPIGRYLPARMQIIADKWFYDLVWHSLQIPVPRIKNIQGLAVNKTRVEIFIRKDILERR